MGKFDKKSWAEKLPPATEDVNEENFNKFFDMLFERQEIWYRRFVLKQPAPWTKNWILRDYKFTNAYRELDRASQWLVHNVLTDHTLSKPDLIFRILIYRFFNQPTTFDKGYSKHAIQLPHYKDFNSQNLWEQIVNYREKVDNPWHTAYLMNPGGAKPKDWNKRGLYRDDMYANTVFNQAHKKIPEICSVLKTAKKPQDVIDVLEGILSVAGFMAHEFYLDFCYCEKYWREKIMEFDQNDFTNVGPGCSTGIRMIFPSLEGKEQIQAIYWLKELAEEHLNKRGEFKYLYWDKDKLEYYVDHTKPNLTLHTFEFALCEFQKYIKMEWGEGKQRSKFTPYTKIKGYKNSEQQLFD